jgi:hypothetical protein
MSEIREMTWRLAPTLVAVREGPFWVCLVEPPPPPAMEETPGGSRPEAQLEFWIGGAFEHWFPNDDCAAIFTVMSGTVSGSPIARRPGRRARASWLTARFVCGLSEKGEAYSVVTLATGEGYVEGTPVRGYLLDAMRSKFGYPPGPESPYDLEIGPGDG